LHSSGLCCPQFGCQINQIVLFSEINARFQYVLFLLQQLFLSLFKSYLLIEEIQEKKVE